MQEGTRRRSRIHCNDRCQWIEQLRDQSQRKIRQGEYIYIILKKDGRPTNKAKNRRRIIDQYSSFPSMVFPNKPITFERKRMPEGSASLEQQGTRAAGGRVPGWPGMC